MANTQDSRIRLKRSSTTTTEPTVAPSTDHTDGTWVSTDLYVGELFLNTADDKLWIRTDSGTKNIPMGCDVRCASLSIASADVLTLNSTPLTIVAAQGAGTTIEPITAKMKIVFGTTPYATNTTLQIQHAGAALGIVQNSSLNSTISNITNFDAQVAPTSLNTQMLENAALEVQVNTGNPTAGDSDITIHVYYRVINV